MRRLVTLFSCLAVFPVLVTAQNADAHFQTPRIANLAHHSTFVHGYLHGYEEGFHEADFDLHMGRIARGDYSRGHGTTGYRREFGPKRMFDEGFREGFRVGYSDGASGRSFQAIDTVASAAGQEHAEDARSSNVFDEGVRLGYVAGQHQGLDDARNQHEANPTPACPLNNGVTKQEFCSAYASGFGMGYADGFKNQTKTVVAAGGNQ